MIRKLYICLLCLLATASLTAQDKVIGRLMQDLNKQVDSAAYIDVLNHIGLRYHLSNTDSCFVYAVKARAVAERMHYKNGIAGALNTLSIFYALKANMKQAIEYDYRAMLLYRELADSANICQVLMNISIYHQFTGMEQEGQLSLFEALDIGSRLPEEKDSVYCLVLLNYSIRFYNDTTRQDSVQWALNKALQIAKRYPDSREIYYLQAFRAEELLDRGAYTQAFNIIDTLATKAEQQGLTYVAADLYGYITVHFKNNYIPACIPYLQKSLKLGLRGGYTDLMLPTVAGLYKYYLNKGDKDSAAIYGHIIWELTDRQHRMKNDRTVNYLDYFLKEQELNEWELSNKVQEERIGKANMKRTNRQWLIVMLAGILLSLIGFTISRYRSYRNLRQQERMLANMNAEISEKNEQLRIHDDFKNKLISIIAHDFREPLNDVVHVAGLFQNENADRESLQQIVDKAEQSSRKTLIVFDGILRWIKSQLSGFVYSPAPCHLQALMNEVIPHIGDTIPGNLTVAGDPEMLQFIHRSLLRRGDQPEIKAVKAAEEITVTISLHAPDFQHDNLTYMICKDFMDKMGGKIQAKVNNEQLIFTYSLPSFD